MGHCLPPRNLFNCPQNPPCCECQGIHCMIPHPGHSHWNSSLLEEEMEEEMAERLRGDV